ncbi:MAG: alpha/beta fold hydrolase [Pseudoalteromonas spongiae]
MSSKIYFSSSAKRKPLAYYLIKAASTTALKIAPKFAFNQTRKLLLTPVKNRKRTTLSAQFTQQKLSTEHGDLHLTSIGEGPAVVFTHGWSGSSRQFLPLMEKVAASGFKAMAFDHYGHGESDGKFANLPLFIKGLKSVMASIEQPKAIVSHSMGTIAALNVSKDVPHFLIAPTFGFYDSFEERILNTGIHQHLFSGVLKSVEDEHDMRFGEILPELHVADHAHPIHIIHDQKDRFAKFELTNQQASQHSHINLKAVNKLGHGRIINSEETWQFMKQSLFA